MIREERDPGFWRAVAAHPAVEPHVLFGLSPERLDPLVLNSLNLPIAAEHGGFIFLAKPWGYELHTLFTPEGWGREVNSAIKAAFGRLFAEDLIINTHEVEGHWRSAPPKSHGWKPAGDFAPSTLPVRLRPWVITREAWRASPAFRRHSCP